MIARGSVTLICAESGTGKTWVAYHIAGCVARGIAVLGHQVHPCEVLYLDGENPLYVVKQRLFDLGIPETPNLTVWGGWSLSPPVGPHHPLVIEFARRKRGLIIYDSLIEFHSGSEQSSTETRAFMRHFRTLANLGATIIVLGNSGKAETANFGLEFRRGHGFVPSQGARTVAEVITQIITANPDCNQRTIIELGRAQGYSKGQLEAGLKAGSWGKTKGPHNSTLYNLAPGGAPWEGQG
jgi:RecA-family ATPase